MKKSSKEKIEKLLFYIFDKFILSVDRYKHNGSFWIIDTKNERWILEFTQTKTLWYNFSFFEKKMKLCNLDCVDNKDFIQKWFESRFLNINPVEDTIQNGVKHTEVELSEIKATVEDTIQNGVKHTVLKTKLYFGQVEDTIQNGVKETTPSGYLGSIEMKGKVVHQIESPKQNNEVEDTIQNGIKEIKRSYEVSRKHRTKNTIQNGVKQIDQGIPLHVLRSEDTIQNGVKHIGGNALPINGAVQEIIQDGVKETWEGWMHGLYEAQKVIQNGIKETFQENHHRRREVMEVINKTQPVYHRPESTVKNVIKRNKNK
jgi:hypothetical protein